ncbi:MAG: YdcF family protein [Planctomycetota bacterium]|nr:YdcF family protein [Planctomycetaceae bacterium]MDQ3332509.1 YdcF family protein [Planctomycetota bacterium]
MPSRRRRLATLRVLGSQPTHATDEPNEHGMDASTQPQDADRDAGRPRSAPTFCCPQPVPPKPYRETVVDSHEPRALARGASTASLTLKGEAMTRPQAASSGSAYEPVRPAQRQQSPSGVRPFWDGSPLREEHEESPSEDLSAGPAWAAFARGVALFFGTLIVVDLFSPSSHFTGSLWWLDLRPLPVSVATGFLGVCAAVLVAFAARASLPKPIRVVATVCVVLMIVIALKDATLYYGLLKRGDLHAGPPVAFSLHVAACLGAIVLALRATPSAAGVKDVLCVLLGFNAALISLPVAQIACTGPIDGRRSAAAVVVFAPRAFEPETCFENRALAAIALHKAGLIPRFLVAGDADGERLEEMQRLAAEAGIAESSVVSLPAGDEAATFRALKAEFPTADGRDPELLAVSDFDHLPRLQMTARRAGVKLATVPAVAAQSPSRTVLLRETLELWRQYFRR